jgi:hypothetical protein
MKIRIPGWVKGDVVPSTLYSYSDNKRLSYKVLVNGIEEGSLESDGYFTISRKWKKGDKVEIAFDMQPRTVRANGKVEADKGQVSVERGPIVYCAEWPDNNFDIAGMLVNQNPKFQMSDYKVLEYPVKALATDAQILDFDKNGRLQAKDVTLKLIPYYAWCHRGSGKMKVWLPQDLNATRPTEPPTLASESKLSASTETPSLSALNDRLLPKDADDRSIPYYHWWPKNNCTEWFVYDFKQASEVKSSTVYWFDDAPWGGCRVPESWKLYYKDSAGNWQPVKNITPYSVERGVACKVDFETVKTTAIKLEVKLPEMFSSGVYEWKVE